MNSLLDYQKDGGVATIRLNDTRRRNGLSPDMVDGLIDLLTRIRRERDVRCVVLTGNGEVFSAGGDPRRMLAPDLYPAMSTAELRRFYKEGIQRLPLALHDFDIPIIAAVDGPAIGAGCDLACLCDFRIASERATFSSSFVKLGIIPGDGGAWLLPRIVGSGHAAEMLLSGAAIDAQTALGMGLVSAVTPPQNLLALAGEKARRIAANPPHAVQMAKRLMQESRSLSLPAALELSASMQALCHRMEDHREAVSALLEKRAPHFTGK